MKPSGLSNTYAARSSMNAAIVASGPYKLRYVDRVDYTRLRMIEQKQRKVFNYLNR